MTSTKGWRDKNPERAREIKREENRKLVQRRRVERLAAMREAPLDEFKGTVKTNEGWRDPVSYHRHLEEVLRNQHRSYKARKGWRER